MTTTTNPKNNTRRPRRPRPFQSVNHAITWFKVWADGDSTCQLVGIPLSSFPTVESLRSTNHVVAEVANEEMQEIHCEILARFHKLTENEHVENEEAINILPVTFRAPKTSQWRAPKFNRELEAGRKEFREVGLTWEPQGHWEPGIDAAGVERLVWVNDQGVTILPIPQEDRRPKRKTKAA